MSNNLAWAGAIEGAMPFLHEWIRDRMASAEAAKRREEHVSDRVAHGKFSFMMNKDRPRLYRESMVQDEPSASADPMSGVGKPNLGQWKQKNDLSLDEGLGFVESVLRGGGSPGVKIEDRVEPQDPLLGLKAEELKARINATNALAGNRKSGTSQNRMERLRLEEMLSGKNYAELGAYSAWQIAQKVNRLNQLRELEGLDPWAEVPTENIDPSNPAGLRPPR